ncbi:hypothetical protein A4G18_08180 [Pasteurellaceae bacterium Pebbles2]|nr:hypothetical protein [Pasteurellaceae bacterium Pebbles2]
MNDLCELSIYGVKIFHPIEWSVMINPASKFEFNEGEIKVDNLKSELSLSLRWALMKDDITPNDYISELKETFLEKERKSKGKEIYRLLDFFEKENVKGENLCFLNTEIYANHSILGVFRKREMVKSIQAIYFSKTTRRIIIATISSVKDIFELDDYMEILSTLTEE